MKVIAGSWETSAGSQVAYIACCLQELLSTQKTLLSYDASLLQKDPCQGQMTCPTSNSAATPEIEFCPALRTALQESVNTASPWAGKRGHPWTPCLLYNVKAHLGPEVITVLAAWGMPSSSQLQKWPKESVSRLEPKLSVTLNWGWVLGTLRHLLRLQEKDSCWPHHLPTCWVIHRAVALASEGGCPAVDWSRVW